MTSQRNDEPAFAAARERFAALTDAAIAEYLRQHPVGSEHLRRAAETYVERPAKRLRPAILMLACGAAGGEVSQSVPAAAAVELFHTWTLVHDDIIDNDPVRRGAPTVHCEAARWARECFGVGGSKADEYGRDMAILAGDLQQGWAVALLLGCLERGVSPAVVLDMVRGMTAWLTPKLLEGEALDVQLSLRPFTDLSSADILRMMELKTGVLLEYAARCGAAIGSNGTLWDSPVADALGVFALNCGIAFQIQDDILGLTGEERKLGKPVGADLREGKRTLIMLNAWRRGTQGDRQLLTHAVGNPNLSPRTLGLVRECLVRTGAVSEACAVAEDHLGKALKALKQLVPVSDFRDLLRAFADVMLVREF